MSEAKDGGEIAPLLEKNEDGAAVPDTVNEDTDDAPEPPTVTAKGKNKDFSTPIIERDHGIVTKDQDKTVTTPGTEGDQDSAIEDKDKTATTPIVDKDQGMDPVSPIKSYELGTDHIERVTSNGETRYEGKGRNRTESFSHLPTTAVGEPVPRTIKRSSAPGTIRSNKPTSQVQADSGPSTAPSTRPSTRPSSQDQTGSAPSTAPSTRPVSESQAGKQPSTAEATPSTDKENGNSADVTPQVESAASKRQDNSAPPTDQGDSVPAKMQDVSVSPSDQEDGLAENAAQSTMPPRNCQIRHDCGCMDIYDYEGKKRQQACDNHRLNPYRSVLLSPPKMPLGESTNLLEGSKRLSVYTPPAQREESPPRQPPVRTPTKGRNFVQASERGPTFLDPFNSDRAIEPTGPPNSLTTLPTAELDEKVKKVRKSRRKASDPQSSHSETSEDPPTPPLPPEGKSDDWEPQPEVWDAAKGQCPRSEVSMDEKRKGEDATTGPEQAAQDVTTESEQATEDVMTGSKQAEDVSTGPEQAAEDATTKPEQAAQGSTTEPGRGEGSEGEDRGEDSSSDERDVQIFAGRQSQDSKIIPSTPAHRDPNVQPSKPILKKPSGTAAEEGVGDDKANLAGKALALFQRGANLLKAKPDEQRQLDANTLANSPMPGSFELRGPSSGGGVKLPLQMLQRDNQLASETRAVDEAAHLDLPADYETVDTEDDDEYEHEIDCLCTICARKLSRPCRPQ